MVLRNTAGQPIRTSLAVVGMSLAVAILIVGLFFVDAIQELLRAQFEVMQRQDVLCVSSASFALTRFLAASRPISRPPV
jgi:hypothetical protein